MRRPHARRLLLGAPMLIAALLAAGCGTGATPPRSPQSAAGRGAVSVLYAGSLAAVMENDLGPRFTHATGYRFLGYPAGSQALANEIRGRLQRADVFISASPQVDGLLEGRKGGDWVRWYAVFAASPLVIGYSPHSRFAQQLRTRPWYAVLAEPGFRLGRTDPRLDPKGALTVQFVARAASLYGMPELPGRILGSPENPTQVFPEEDLIGRLEAGQLDAGFFYKSEAVAAGIPTVALPAAIDLQATFTVTVVSGAPNAQGAAAFVRFLLGRAGRAILRRYGLTTFAPRLHGPLSAVPPGLRSRIGR